MSDDLLQYIRYINYYILFVYKVVFLPRNASSLREAGNEDEKYKSDLVVRRNTFFSCKYPWTRTVKVSRGSPLTEYKTTTDIVNSVIN